MRARTPCQNTAVPKTQTTSPTTPHFQRFSPKWSAIWAPHRLKSRPRRHQSGELHYTSLRHAARKLRVAQTPTTAGAEGAGGAGGHGRLRDAGQAAAPVGGGRAWPGFEATHNRASTAGAEGAGRTRGLRCQVAAHGHTKQPGPEQQREVRCTRYGPLHPIRRGALPTDRVQHTQSQEQTRNLRDAGLAAALVGDGWAWPDNESTRRAELAARTTRGRAATHGRTKQPGPQPQLSRHSTSRRRGHRRR